MGFRNGIVALALGAISLAACETMSEEDCLYADWERIGYDDGLRGRETSYLSRRRKACSQYTASAPDEAAYFRGRQEGLKRYCTPENAFALGRDGVRYQGVCPVDAAGAFLDAYTDGREVYLALERYRRIEGEIFELERRASGLQSKARRIRDQLLSDTDLDQNARNKLARELERLEDDARDLRRRLSFLQSELAQASAALALIRSRYPGSVSVPY